MMMAQSVAEEFVKLWGSDGADELRAKVAALKASDSLGILTMFAFIVGDPADDTLRAEFYEFLEDDDAGPEVTDWNFYWEMEKSMKAFADLKRAEKAWASRTTANAGPNCDQCGNARTGIGGRVCELCDLARQDPAIVHNHNHVICHCCVDDREDYDYDDGNQPPRWKDAPRRTYDDGFAEDYDADDEEGERRQEMAENAERQMEAEAGHRALPSGDDICHFCNKTLRRCWCDESDVRDSSSSRWAEQVDPLGRSFGAGIERENERIGALNRAVFEHNSTPTEDPHIRITHNVSPVVPDNWQEIVNRC
jgi:hypothetical protein